MLYLFWNFEGSANASIFLKTSKQIILNKSEECYVVRADLKTEYDILTSFLDSQIK